MTATISNINERLEGIRKNFKPRTFVMAIHTTAKGNEMVDVLATAVQQDANALLNTERNAATIGEILHNLLKAKAEPFADFCTAYAKRTGVDEPVDFPAAERGRRTLLANVAYGKFPDMLKPQGANKDSRAGMRVTYFLRAYRIKAGIIKAPKRAAKAAQGKNMPRTFKEAWQRMWSVATPDQQLALRAIADAAKLDSNLLVAWVVAKPTPKARRKRTAAAQQQAA